MGDRRYLDADGRRKDPATRRFTEQRWGTPNPVMMRDAQLGA